MGKKYVLNSALVLGCFILVSFNQVNAIEVYRTDHELIDTVKITHKVREPQVVYSVGPLQLNTGDVIDVRVQTVLTVNCTDNIGIGRYIVRTKHPTSVNGKRIVKAVMSNANRDDHHAVLVHSGIEVIEHTSMDDYINVVVFAQSTQCQGKTIAIEGAQSSQFGEFIVLIH